MQLKCITKIDYMYMYPSSPHETAQIPWKIRLNSRENLTHYYLLTCRIVVNVIVWEIGRGKQAAGQSRAVCRVMWTKCLPHDTVQQMEAALRNSYKTICKDRKLRLQVPGKVSSESGLTLGHILDSMGICVWSLMISHIKGKQPCTKTIFNN